jgi:gluconate 2-dehydrogenase gamma chain
MSWKFVSRRDVLKSLTMGTLAGSVLQVIPAQAAEYAHHMVEEEKAAAPDGSYVPKFFSPNHYQTLRALCQAIIPPDGSAGGAIEAGAPEWIDLLTSENSEYQLKLDGGIMWLDHACSGRYGNAYLGCTVEQQKQMLDLIAYRKNAKDDPSLSQGIEFFAFLRKLVADGFFTSKIGIQYLDYIGNTYLTSFPGCPPVPGV